MQSGQETPVNSVHDLQLSHVLLLYLDLKTATNECWDAYAGSMYTSTQRNDIWCSWTLSVVSNKGMNPCKPNVICRQHLLSQITK